MSTSAADRQRRSALAELARGQDAILAESKRIRSELMAALQFANVAGVAALLGRSGEADIRVLAVRLEALARRAVELLDEERRIATEAL